MNENQMYEKEINLKDLFFYCLKKWRWIILAMFIGALLVGGYQYQATIKNNQLKQEAAALSQAAMEEQEEKVIVNPNIAHYELAIQNAEQEAEQFRNYMENSVIMKLDATQLQTGTVSFYLGTSGSESNLLDGVVSGYQTYVTDGSLARNLQAADSSISLSDLQYLLKFLYGKVTSNSSQIFQIQVTAPTSELCEEYLNIIEEAMVSYSEDIEQKLGKHELRVLAVTQTERVDMELLEYQTTLNTSYMEAVKRVPALRTELDTIRSEEGETITIVEEVVLENPMTVAVKYSILGLVLGGFLAMLALVISYILSDKLQSLDGFENIYGMKLLGQVGEQPEKRLFGFVDQWINRLAEGVFAALPYEERVKIAVSNVKAEIGRFEGLKRVMVAGTMAEKDTQEFCRMMKEDISQIIFSSYSQIVFSSAALEKLDSFDAVLFIEQKGVSDTNLIRQERELASGRNVTVLGVVVV